MQSTNSMEYNDYPEYLCDFPKHILLTPNNKIL